MKQKLYSHVPTQLIAAQLRLPARAFMGRFFRPFLQFIGYFIQCDNSKIALNLKNFRVHG